MVGGGGMTYHHMVSMETIVGVAWFQVGEGHRGVGGEDETVLLIRPVLQSRQATALTVVNLWQPGGTKAGDGGGGEGAQSHSVFQKGILTAGIS